MTFHCDCCRRSFTTLGQCAQHMTDAGHWALEYECYTCNDRFATHWEADQHMETQQHFPYQCETCTYGSLHQTDIIEHQADNGHYKHLYCRHCDRYFQNANDMDQHLKSRVHQGAQVACPFCNRGFTTASGVAHHLETSSCPQRRGLTREIIHQELRRHDPSGTFTERVLEYPQSEPHWNPRSSWNGRAYECYICHCEFDSVRAMAQHVKSSAHRASLYHCPNRTGSCGGRKFHTLASLLNHLESETCRFMKFANVSRVPNNIFTRREQALLMER